MADYGRVRVGGAETWVRVDGESLTPLVAAPWIDPTPQPGASPLDPSHVSWLPPVTPSKILGVGRNYAQHAKEHGVEVPTSPLLFLKAPSSLLVGGESVKLPPESKQVECEGELGIVIGRRLRRFNPNGDLGDAVFAYFAADDVTARDVQRSDGQWARGKSFDGFCPVSRLIRTEAPAPGAMLTTRFNGAVRQAAPISDMVFGIAAILEHASAAMTLEPGDIILTGTPAGVAGLLEGDEVTIEIEGVPPLVHGVAKEEAAAAARERA